MKILKICLISILSTSCITTYIPSEQEYVRKVSLIKKSHTKKQDLETQNISKIIIRSKKKSSYNMNFLMLKKTANFLGCDSLSEILITKQKANGNCVKFVTNSNN